MFVIANSHCVQRSARSAIVVIRQKKGIHRMLCLCVQKQSGENQTPLF
jgi:hypothetical protein